ncbi:MAG: hypothetical protein A2700_02495 [Candidatus Blackburnbacteria bacterium RIFCSPHIGHO2_01_FULL_44_64]|uniref:HTH cro/C1-type domain-containing protein n=1 Tax=Candidatus Blackburnbacteria bacterium RIFCSPHIGHO2_02_FULL_44_20 TaxID=1797516 RepID=A0A1G1V805_9BACT|nr:MAG: hypothetical protein A2700_02495 [Candidatus Blackburnbacteria bacterium RIFCSPHIGHO2_01_FULL_44_64]OGY11312.1 MAG: hypothetical protein A3D26_02295 [Candidatus Blackburnbacteria bacterium RIFCSPHIGHO2_02_FULL_44_20]OGY11459.1 MAG: hypothetical protein A3E16_02245 [Candidatus Blackburnbacteria bacterium RIFCSPHIGHO2_12_FULL_44_25]OGY14381.1 MAG: hypothetical protein A3A62_01815 [Candidatus Blackburnbacteria bacterium RIFCSPLOWO2_01_FULL_44_43]OGY17355.1 MAG: hypothetical protein A3H88_0
MAPAQQVGGSQTLADWVRTRRAELHLSQEELGQQVGLSASLIRKIELGLRGAKRPRAGTIHRLSTVLGAFPPESQGTTTNLKGQYKQKEVSSFTPAFTRRNVRYGWWAHIPSGSLFLYVVERFCHYETYKLVLETPATKWYNPDNAHRTDVYVAEDDWDKFTQVMTALREAICALPPEAAEQLLMPDSYAAGVAAGQSQKPARRR